jgi:hypothetical protein
MAELAGGPDRRNVATMMSMPIAFPVATRYRSARVP